MENNWSTIISSKSKWYKINLKEIWDYRDLIWIFVRRDIIAIYKQTILGPIWFLLGPLFTVFTYTFLFSEVAHLSTDGLPGPLFYLGGTTLWNYFQACFNGASNTFSSNVGIFGKVYFPRLITPISMIISNLLKFIFQFLIYIAFLIYYNFNTESLHLNYYLIVLIPFILLVLAMISMGMGLIVSSFTSKYRDLSMLIGVFLTLVMYATPIMYPISAVPNLYKPYLFLNPISPMIEFFRYIFTGRGSFTSLQLLYSFIFGFVSMFIGILFFNKTEKTFMDTV